MLYRKPSLKKGTFQETKRNKHVQTHPRIPTFLMKSLNWPICAGY